MTLKSGRKSELDCFGLRLRRFDLQIFGGKGGGGSSSAQYRKRDPEPQGLTDLRQGLFDKIFPNLESYDPARWTDAQNIADNALKNQGSAIDEMFDMARTGNIPQGFRDNAMATINRGLQSGMGDMLNSLGNRGVLNSSITNTGISGLGTKAANAFQDSFLNSFNSLLGGYQGAAQGYSGIGNQAFQNAGAALMPAYNFWKDWQSSYDGKEDFDTVVSQRSGKK